MAIKLGVSLLLVSLAASFFLPTGSAAAAQYKGKSLVRKTCGRTEFPDVCISTLESDPRSSTADLVGLSRISLEQTVKLAGNAEQLALNLTNNATDYATWAERSTCYHGFDDSIKEIKNNGFQYFDQRKYNKTYQLVDTLKGSVDYCMTFDIPQLTGKNTVLARFTADVKTILHLLF